MRALTLFESKPARKDTKNRPPILKGKRRKEEKKKTKNLRNAQSLFW
jgi:hypothetical protein